MALTIPPQAIKFLEANETPFNDQVICGCDLQEDWSYLYTDGDIISFQISSYGSEGDNFIKNGSFEEGTSAYSITDWTRSVENNEQTNVARLSDNSAPCGQYWLYFTNENVTGTFPTYARVTQTLTPSLAVSKTYKVTLKAKITAPNVLNGNNNILKITLGGQVKYITPTNTFQTYTLYFTFTTTPSDSNLIIEINDGVYTDTSRLYVDCVTINQYDTCSVVPHINNGCFEDGQNPIDFNVGNLDNWITDTGVNAISINGGLNGTRCAKLAIGEYIEQQDCLISGLMVLKFWAKSVDDTSNLVVTTETSSTQIANIAAVPLVWTQYTYKFTVTSDKNLKFFQNTDTYVLIDCVELYSYPAITLTIDDGESAIPVNANTISVYENAINVNIPIDSYEFPSCFKICIDSCFQDTCSEWMKYSPELNSCTKELVWYDSEDSAMGINYLSGFKNKVRLQGQLQNPSYIKEDYVKVLNGETSFINALKVRKTIDLSLDSMPEFMWDRMAMMIGVSNIEYNGVELCSSLDSEITINYDKNTLLYSGSVLLSPKGEYIVERSYNCS